MSVPHGYAQTNLQLYFQLHQAEYSLEDLNHIQLAYEFASELFTCQFRPSGKSFLSHLIGTASILGSLHVSKDIIAAGLLHAAYDYGDFGDGSQGIISWKRKEVGLRVGPETEEYIAQYDALKWNESTIPAIPGSVDKMGPFDRSILLMRLANELEDLLDHALVYLPNAQDRMQRYQKWKQEYIALATHLGHPNLGNKLRTAIEDTQKELASQVTTGQNSFYKVWPYTILPFSHKYHLSITLRRTITQRANRFPGDRAHQKRQPFTSRILISRLAKFLKTRTPFMKGT